MNIIFCDKLTNCCFINLVQHEQHKELLDIVTDKMACGGWNQQHDGDWQAEPETAYRPAYPKWNAQRGLMVQMRLSVPARDAEMRDGLPVTRYFDWRIESAEVDQYGYVPPGAVWHCQINGGLMNHGTFENPSWSSHT